MKPRQALFAGLIAMLLFPLQAQAQAAVTSNSLETLVTSDAGLPFRQRVEFGLVLTAENVAAESTATARHAQRALLASQVLNNPDSYVKQFSQAVVVQLNLATTNMVTVNAIPNADVDTTDTVIQTDISAIWNALTQQ